MTKTAKKNPAADAEAASDLREAAMKTLAAIEAHLNQFK